MTLQSLSTPVFINTAKRTPIGKFGGSLLKLDAAHLAAESLKGMIQARERDQAPDFVFLGHARQAGCGPNPARQATIFSGLSESVPATTFNHACASGIVSVIHGVEKILLGRAQTVFAGGVESMSNTPYMALKARWGQKMGNQVFEDGMYKDGFFCPMAERVMGSTVEDFIVPERKISREAQDAFALHSQKKTQAAWESKLFESELCDVQYKDKTLLTTDEHMRPQTTPESLAKLKPVFTPETGTLTAGNCSGVTDGSVFLEISPENSPGSLAEIIDWEYCALDPKLMGLGPVPATQKLLKKTGLTIQDINIFELNEAFAAQALACQSDLEIPDEKLNPLGGAIALGHPIGATGARLLGTLAHQLHRKGQGALGIATLCVSGGQGLAVLLRGA